MSKKSIKSYVEDYNTLKKILYFVHYMGVLRLNHDGISYFHHPNSRKIILLLLKTIKQNIDKINTLVYKKELQSMYNKIVMPTMYLYDIYNFDNLKNLFENMEELNERKNNIRLNIADINLKYKYDLTKLDSDASNLPPGRYDQLFLPLMIDKEDKIKEKKQELSYVLAELDSVKTKYNRMQDQVKGNESKIFDLLDEINYKVRLILVILKVPPPTPTALARLLTSPRPPSSPPMM